MSLEKLINAIDRKAREEAGAILSKAGEEARGILQEGKRQNTVEAKQLLQSTLDHFRKEASQRLSQTRLTARNRLLEVEQELVEHAFERALQTLQEMDDEAYRTWLGYQLVRACRSPEETVIVAHADRERLSPEWVHDTLASIPEGYRPRGIAFTGEGPGHGFLLQHPKYEVNVTFEALLHAARQTHRTEVAKWLLGKMNNE